jgi:tRNA (guanine37-N1)-methyltransferase
MLEVQIFTLYPDLYPGLLDVGIYKKAKEKQKWSLKIIDIRDYAFDENRTVDDTPFGGGGGMLLKPDVVASALDKNIKAKEKIIYLSPKGKRLDQKEVKSLSKLKKINILCGHFEGVDQRLLETRNIEEYSIGDFILSGGESASFVFVDALVRLLPGVLGNANSAKDESFENNLLEYPQYTKPRDWEGKKVPEVLFSGDHAKIKGWRLSQSEAITQRQRPDLWKKYLEKKNEKH